MNTLADRILALPRQDIERFKKYMTSTLEGLAHMQAMDPDMRLVEMLKQATLIASDDYRLDVDRLLREQSGVVPTVGVGADDIDAKVDSEEEEEETIEEDDVEETLEEEVLDGPTTKGRSKKDPVKAEAARVAMHEFLRKQTEPTHYLKLHEVAKPLLDPAKDMETYVNSLLNRDKRRFTRVKKGYYIATKPSERKVQNDKFWSSASRPTDLIETVAMVLAAGEAKPRTIYEAMCKVGWGEGISLQDVQKCLHFNNNVFDPTTRSRYKLLHPEHYMRVVVTKTGQITWPGQPTWPASVNLTST